MSKKYVVLQFLKKSGRKKEWRDLDIKSFKENVTQEDLAKWIEIVRTIKEPKRIIKRTEEVVVETTGR